MDDFVAPEDALLPIVPEPELAAWLPLGDSILVRRTSTKIQRNDERLEAWSRAFVLSRLRADGARDCSSINHPEGFQLISRTLDGARLYIQATRPEAAHG